MNDTLKIGPQVARPSAEEITAAIQQVEQSDGVTLSATDAERYLMLRAELGWWITVSEESVTEAMAGELQTQVREETGEDISLADAYARATASLIASAENEKERIGGEIRAIINQLK